MSHVTVRRCQVVDYETAARAAPRVAAELLPKTAGPTIAVKLRNWKNPVYFTDGEARFDNYDGRWGAESELDAFLQRYAMEAAKRVAEARGLRCEESVLIDGRMKLVVHVEEDAHPLALAEA